MNREILFRGFHEDKNGTEIIYIDGKAVKGKWVYGYYFKTPLTDEATGSKSEDGWYFLSGRKRHCISTENGCVYEVIPETVGQYTGLDDKNDMPIFKGDIVKALHDTHKDNPPKLSYNFEKKKNDLYTSYQYNRNYQVEWWNKYANYRVRNKNINFKLTSNTICTTQIEVIGTIFDEVREDEKY